MGQLGWYTDQQVTVTIGGTFNLIGISDYGATTNNDKTNIQIPGDTEDFYVTFNRKSGINSGTVEGGNQVFVHKRPTGNGYGESDLVAKLNAGGNYDGASLSVTVLSIDLSSTPPHASVQIGSSTPAPNIPPTPSPTNSPTPSPTTPSPTNSPTPSPTDSPTVSPTNSPTPSPTNFPTPSPTNYPTPSPINYPTPSPINYPTASPTNYQTPLPTSTPTPDPPSPVMTPYPTEK